MLYLKLAQLRSQLQASRTEINAAEDASDRYAAFYASIFHQASQLQKQIQVLWNWMEWQEKITKRETEMQELT